MNIKTFYKSPAERQPGAKWTTNNFGEIEIIGKIDDGTGRNYFIRFLNTGSEIIANGSRFKSGDIKDPMAKTACGVGCFGIGKYSGKTHERELKLWHGILTRCYNPGARQETYKGVTVCERWLNFQNFCEDIKDVSGYERWLTDHSMSIDKDGIIEGNKIYSKETCQFIYCGDNTRLSNKSKSVYKAISPVNEIFYFRNQRIFAENNNMTKGGISSVIAGKQHSHRNWKFEKLTEDEIKLINPELIQD